MKDKRDGKSYVIRKLADGNCYMVQNLALFSGMRLTPELSNVTQEYVLPTSGMQNRTHIDNELRKTVNTTNDNLGSLYIWNIAVAGTNTQYTSGVQDVVQDICPKNWKLPTKTNYDNLYNVFKPAALFVSGYNVQYTGDARGYIDSYEFWWAGTSSGSDNAYGPYISGTSTSNSVNARTSYQWSIRCMAKTNS